MAVSRFFFFFFQVASHPTDYKIRGCSQSACKRLVHNRHFDTVKGFNGEQASFLLVGFIGLRDI